ncbi:MAG TPA: hypothetical protein VE175_06770 [Woeseiaceae bacterium]|nr:hypothetical protein [Woeseiaceae bacterium]
MKLWKSIVLGVLLWGAPLALADSYAQFPGPPIDGSTLRFKQKVEEIYASGNLERALLIYEKELAPQGDKYAQYMAGYMHLTGRGVEADAGKALAWYQLAAERGEPKFIEARDRLRGSLAPHELDRAQALFAGLWRRYGDRKLILDLVEEDVEILARRDSDSGVFGTSEGAGLVSGYSQDRAGNPYYRRVREQLEERLRYLDAMTDPEGLENSRMDAREADLRRKIKALDLP